MPRRSMRRNRPLFASPVPREVSKPKIKWRPLPILWLAIKKTCFLIGALVLLSVTSSILLTVFASKAVTTTLPDEIVLFIDFDKGLHELPQQPSFADPFAMAHPTVREMINAIDTAAVDSRVKGLFARVDASNFAIAHIEELRSAIKRFRDSGKFAHIYSRSYSGLGTYYLASSFDQVWVQPMGVISITGINAEVPFFRQTLDKIGVTPQFYKRRDYKTAYESITDAGMSQENREMIDRMIEDFRAVLSGAIAGDLEVSDAQFETLVNQGLFTAQEAESARLVDRADYADILVEDIKEQITGDREYDDDLFVDISQYAAAINHEAAGPEVALVYAVGAIMQSAGNGGAPGLIDDGIAAADEIGPAILDAADDENIKAIVMRIDSPGGSPTASESILRAIEKAQAKGKIVIVSMGPTAASGGYWIAAYADTIFAMPTTITGSIGVVGGKFVLQDLWSKIGVNWESVRWGENAALWSGNSPFSPTEEERINAMMDQIYDGFVARVSRGRGMTAQEVDKIAGGRVWTGSRAVEIGLADQLGGLNEALDFTARRLGVESRHDLSIAIMPKPKTRIEHFLELMGGQVRFAETLRAQEALIRWAEPLLRLIALSENPENYATYEPLRID